MLYTVPRAAVLTNEEALPLTGFLGAGQRARGASAHPARAAPVGKARKVRRGAWVGLVPLMQGNTEKFLSENYHGLCL